MVCVYPDSFKKHSCMTSSVAQNLPLSSTSCCCSSYPFIPDSWYLERELGQKLRGGGVLWVYQDKLCIKQTKAWTSEPWVWLVHCALEKQMSPSAKLMEPPTVHLCKQCQGEEEYALLFLFSDSLLPNSLALIFIGATCSHNITSRQRADLCFSCYQANYQNVTFH